MTEHQLCTAALVRACQTWCLQEKTNCIILSRAWSIGKVSRRVKYGRCAMCSGGSGEDVYQMREFLTVHTGGTLWPCLCLRAWPCLREGMEGRARERRAPRGVMVLVLPRQSCMQHCRRVLALPLACKAFHLIQAGFVTASAYYAQASGLIRIESWSGSWCGDQIGLQGMGHTLRVVRAHKAG